MSYIFVAIPSRLGNKSLRGPVTGKSWLIKPTGTWIDELDKELLKQPIPYYCFKSRSMKESYIYETSPSADQMLLIP